MGRLAGHDPDDRYAYTRRAVTAQNIAQALAYINWVILCSLALGGFGLAWLLRQFTDVTRGYVAFMAGASAVLGLLLFFSDQGLPAPTLIHVTAAPQLDAARRLAIAAFTVLAFIAAIRFRRGSAGWWLGIATLVAGIVADGLAAIGWAGDALYGVPLLVQFLMLAAVTGGAFGSVVLAHWYLVTPRISEAPLILATQALTWALALQLVLFLTWQVVSSTDGPLAQFTGPDALLVWLRLLVGLIFPLVLAYLAWRTARTRSMESATGLLYIMLAAVLASTIVAAALSLTAGVLT
jgi:hypothetical protein